MGFCLGALFFLWLSSLCWNSLSSAFPTQQWVCRNAAYLLSKSALLLCLTGAWLYVNFTDWFRGRLSIHLEAVLFWCLFSVRLMSLLLLKILMPFSILLLRRFVSGCILLSRMFVVFSAVQPTERSQPLIVSAFLDSLKTRVLKSTCDSRQRAECKLPTQP